jgi:hypothetical protein
MESYYELSLLALGAAHVTTIEYNNLAHIHQRITAKSKFNFDALYHSTTSRYRDSFDLEVSMSAFDHDGRGRCGRRYGEIRLSRMGGGLFWDEARLTIIIATSACPKFHSHRHNCLYRGHNRINLIR